MTSRTYPVTAPLDLQRTLGPLARSPYDLTIRLATDRAWRATRTPDGPATIAMIHAGGELRAQAWGPGAEWALGKVPELLSLELDQAPIPSDHPMIRRLERTRPGVRIPRTRAVLESLIPAILEQKITGDEARRAMNGLIRAHGEPAPGPPEFRLRLSPTATTLAALPYYGYHPFGIERRRAELIRRVASRAAWFEAIVDLPLPDAYARLTAVPGIGPWTAAEVGIRALGDSDAVSVGDFHIPSVVGWALVGRSLDDAGMLAVLAPYTPQRQRAVRYLEASGFRRPRFGPRFSPRNYRAI